MKRYDLIVIGAGPAGLSAAIEGAKAGMRTEVSCSSRFTSFSVQRSIMPR